METPIDFTPYLIETRMFSTMRALRIYNMLRTKCPLKPSWVTH